MIDQLRTLYSSFIVYEEGVHDLNDNYKWFLTGDNKIIGIHEDELTSKDESLLAAFLEPYNPEFSPLTEDEQKWRNAIHSQEPNRNSDFKVDLPYRFVHFSIKKNQISPALFNNAIHELFAKQVSIVWENGNQGIIIEQHAVDEESVSYEQIIDILMSDLYIKISFFVGPFREGLEGISDYYHLLRNAAETSFQYSNKTVMTFFEAIPYLLIDQTQPGLLQEIEKTILQEYLEDEETLKMIESFVQHNLNISETSKALHMHRNSLQYRLDRFFENTGIDVRKFHHAMSVYLLLLARK